MTRRTRLGVKLGLGIKLGLGFKLRLRVKLRRRETFRVTRGTLLHDLHNVGTQSLLDGI